MLVYEEKVTHIELFQDIKEEVDDDIEDDKDSERSAFKQVQPTKLKLTSTKEKEKHVWRPYWIFSLVENAAKSISTNGSDIDSFSVDFCGRVKFKSKRLKYNQNVWNKWFFA